MFRRRRRRRRRRKNRTKTIVLPSTRVVLTRGLTLSGDYLRGRTTLIYILLTFSFQNQEECLSVCPSVSQSVCPMPRFGLLCGNYRTDGNQTWSQCGPRSRAADIPLWRPSWWYRWRYYQESVSRKVLQSCKFWLLPCIVNRVRIISCFGHLPPNHTAILENLYAYILQKSQGVKYWGFATVIEGLDRSVAMTENVTTTTQLLRAATPKLKWVSYGLGDDRLFLQCTGSSLK